jgi:hypothetical protein
VPPISFPVIVIAFVAELAADWIIAMLMFDFFSPGTSTSGMNQEQFEQFVQTVSDTTAIIPCLVITGTITTILGAYFAARLAKRIPYYHGLAMGILGTIYILVRWDSDANWIGILGVLTTIPACLYGAHLAKKRLPQQT